MTKYVLLAPLLFVLLSACSQTKPNNKSEFESSHFVLTEGKALFMKHCAPCHGEGGQGDGQYVAMNLEPAPANLASADFQGKVSDKTIFQSIKSGTAKMGKSNLCPPWGHTLSDEEIGWLISFIRTLKE